MVKPWLRLVLVTMTVGGGFSGFAFTFAQIVDNRGPNLRQLLVQTVFFLLFGFVTASGLMFVYDPRRTRLLTAALAVQIPWFSTPLIVCKFFAGFDFVLMAGSPKSPALLGIGFNFEMFMGSSYQFALLTEEPWRMGLNFVPLVLLILLFKARSRSSSEAAAEPSRPTVV